MPKRNAFVPLLLIIATAVGCSPSSFISPDAGIGTAIGGGLGALTGGIIGSRHGYDRSGSALLGAIAGGGLGYIGGTISADVRHSAEVGQARAERAVRRPYLAGLEDSQQLEIDTAYDEISSESRWQPSPPPQLEYPESVGRVYQGPGGSY